ncbi:hypothetical protein POTOM_032554 [Populus tomentosa]|uniref:Reverse transcriptase zinc-binding domain-containing protein n=1 Tax=Populus tomentosa TaxID=118781 RepID=A0A8X8CPW9_POPTO|nr:hypothetical protein POTOM_032554 [Populus tomentosa]
MSSLVRVDFELSMPFGSSCSPLAGNKERKGLDAPVAGKLHPISCSAFQLVMDENLAPSDIQATTSQAYTFKLYRVRGKNEIMIKQLEITPLLKLPAAMPNQMSCEIPLAATFVQLRLHTIDGYLSSMRSSFEQKYNQKLTSLPYTLNGTNDSEIWRSIARVWPHLLHGFSWPHVRPHMTNDASCFHCGFCLESVIHVLRDCTLADFVWNGCNAPDFVSDFLMSDYCPAA